VGTIRIRLKLTSVHPEIQDFWMELSAVSFQLSDKQPFY
jgi:hypothetical protein